MNSKDVSTKMIVSLFGNVLEYMECKMNEERKDERESIRGPISS